MKPSLKVGILAVCAILIFIFTVMWLKGKAISNAERITVSFKDINGMREGSAVQMMGVRIGQVEETAPRLGVSDSSVDVKFVITEPDIVIPPASEISIQQSGIIGEQFLEITPPREKTVYIAETGKSLILHAGDNVEMKLSGKYYNIGEVKKIEIASSDSLPIAVRENIKTKNAYKIKYIINLPGLIIPDMLDASIVKTDDDKKLRLAPKDGIELAYPNTNSPYTVIEPMRIADFLNLQAKSAGALIETNERISMLLSDDVIKDLQNTAANVKQLSEKTGAVIAKAEELIILSKNELEMLASKADKISDNLIAATDNLKKTAGDEAFIENINNTATSIRRVSDNLSVIMEDDKTKAVLKNLEIISKNTAELSSFVNDMSKDAQLKQYLKESAAKLSTALDKLCITLDTVNYAAEDKDKIKQTIDDISETSENLRKFSEKLNKRFLLFRLLL